MSAGGSHSCGITTEGATYCWGSSLAGQLGSDTLGTMSTPYRMPQAPSFVKIASGDDHTCAITTDGKMYCWGENLHGELGRECLQQVLSRRAGGAAAHVGARECRPAQHVRHHHRREAVLLGTR